MGKAPTSASKIVKTRRKELFRLPEGTDDDADDDAKGTDDAKTNPNVPTCDSSDDGDAEDDTRLIPGDCMQLLDQPPLSEVQIAACELFGENFTWCHASFRPTEGLDARSHSAYQ